MDSCDCPKHGCTKTGTQCANISTPIDITPHVKIGELETECVGEPDVCCVENPCEKTIKVVVSQKIRIKIPIEYNVIACIGESSVNCGCEESCRE